MIQYPQKKFSPVPFNFFPFDQYGHLIKFDLSLINLVNIGELYLESFYRLFHDKYILRKY